MAAHQRQSQMFQRHIFVTVGKILFIGGFAFVGRAELTVEDRKILCAFFRHPLFQQFLQGIFLTAGNEVAVFFDNARFRQADLFFGIAEVFGMFQRHIDKNRRFHVFDHIGGVDLAAHTHFHNGGFHAFLSEVVKGHGGIDFKFRRLFKAGFHHRFDVGFHFIEQAGHILVGDLFTADAEPLPIGMKMGRSEHPRFFAGGHQHGIEHRNDAAFAVGAADMNVFHGFFGISQAAKEFLHPVQTEIKPEFR